MNDDRSVDGAYLTALFVCRTVGERPGAHDYGGVFDHLIVDDSSDRHTVTVVARLYGRAPAQGWKVVCSLTYPNESVDWLFEVDIPESDAPMPFTAFMPRWLPVAMPGTYHIDLRVNGKLMGRTPFRVTHEPSKSRMPSLGTKRR